MYVRKATYIPFVSTPVSLDLPTSCNLVDGLKSTLLLSLNIISIMVRLFNLVLTLLVGSALAVPYSEYILAPSSRTVYPVAVHKVNGTVVNAEGLINGVNGTAVFYGSSAVTFDFGKNVAGQVSLVVDRSCHSNAAMWLTFTESSLWISGIASDATASYGVDEPM